ncbi:MAG: anaerobic ribonucleoside-triphosphate reductase activating protein [Clostridiales bacterium]|nr:anaerobic ribonucleoside-triphosphate reductase activating protein [Clostridiales bacterium]
MVSQIDNATNSIVRMCGTEPESIVDGPGFRFVLFVQGCPHRCPGCHNPQSHDFNAGYTVTTQELFEEICKNKYLSGITLSGGEPFCQVEELLPLVRKCKEKGLGIMSYSGYTYEELLERHDPATDELLSYLDILVDGRYIEAQRNLTLIFRGSENQRVIDMNKTRESGQITIWEQDY